MNLQNLAIFVGVSLGALGRGQLLPTERQGLNDALSIGHMTLTDFDFPRTPYGAPTSPFENLALNTPSAGVYKLQEFIASSEKLGISQMIRALSTTAFEDKSVAATFDVSPKDIKGLPSDLQQPCQELVMAVARSNASVRTALKSLSDGDKRKLIEQLPLWCLGEKSIKIEFAKTANYSEKELASLVAKIDLPMLRVAAARLSTDVEGQLPRLKSVAQKSNWKGSVTGVSDGVTYEFSGIGDDTHNQRDRMLCVDLGGNNTYTGRYGVGIGYSGVLINFGEDATYDVPDASAGCGLLGVGLAYDYSSGSGILKGKSLCFGSGIAGVGSFLKREGDNRYAASALAQGFGAWGVGLLLQASNGADMRAGYFAQGAARFGGVGWLSCLGANNRFAAGGLVASPFKNGAWISKSQGYGEGSDAQAGGVGMLTTFGGNNQYNGGELCQGAGRQSGAGLVYEAKGQSIFSAFGQAQGYSTDAGAGYVFALAGDNRYIITTGACHGQASNFGFSFLLDRSGNSLFAALEALPASGFNAGEGVVLLGPGEHRFTGRPSLGGDGLSLLVDLGGSSRFGEGLVGGGQALAHPWSGVVYMREQRDAANDLPGLHTRPKPGSLKAGSEAEIQALVAKAGLPGTDGEAARDQLVGMGKPALDVVLKDLSVRDMLSIDLAELLVHALGSDGRAAIAPLCRDSDTERAKAALTVAADIGGIEFRSAVAAALKQPALADQAAVAAGVVGAQEGIPDLLALTGNPDKKLVVTALRALTKLETDQAFTTAQALLTAKELSVRQAAFDLVTSFKPLAMGLTPGLLSSGDEDQMRLAIQILGQVGSPQAIQQVLLYLDDPRAMVRLQAMLALEGRCPLESRPKLLALQNDQNPLLRAVAARIDPGR